MRSIPTTLISSRTTALVVALLGVVVGLPAVRAAGAVRTSTASVISADADLRRLQDSLATKTAEVEQLREQLRQAQQKQADVLPMVTPMASGTDTRKTLGLAPSSTLTSRTARAVARTMSAQIPGSIIATVQATGSMRPLFDDSALLVLESVPFDSLRIGDIVTYEHSGTHALIVHRLLEKRDGGFWAKGDHNGRMDDSLVTRENYRMRVCGILYTNGDGR